MYLVKQYAKRFFSDMTLESVIGVFDDLETPKNYILEEAERQKSRTYFTRKGKPLLKSRNGYDWFRNFEETERDDFYGVSWTVSAPGVEHTDFVFTITKIEPNTFLCGI